jgi:hypothetical protein
MSNDELNVLATGDDHAAASVFSLENLTRERGERTIRVSIVSGLFARDAFPFEIRYSENLNTVIEQKLG